MDVVQQGGFPRPADSVQDGAVITGEAPAAKEVAQLRGLLVPAEEVGVYEIAVFVLGKVRDGLGLVLPQGEGGLGYLGDGDAAFFGGLVTGLTVKHMGTV